MFSKYWFGIESSYRFILRLNFGLALYYDKNALSVVAGVSTSLEWKFWQL